MKIIPPCPPLKKGGWGDFQVKNIVLIGFMGTGKTVVGKALAEKLGLQFIDTDDLIEEEVKMAISEIFSKYGEEYFREIEKKVVEKISKLKNLVIATGGGMVVRPENIKNLKKNGVIICLTAEPEVILSRIKEETHRPLLRAGDPLKKIEELLAQREKGYRQASIIIDASNLSTEEIVSKILEKIRSSITPSPTLPPRGGGKGGGAIKEGSNGQG